METIKNIELCRMFILGDINVKERIPFKNLIDFSWFF